MIDTYDPLEAPDPGEWQILDESERIHLILDYHYEFDDEMPNVHLHAMIHTVVENQIALDEQRVKETMDRLMNEGLDRHDAIHAIGSVLIKYIWQIGNRETVSDDINKSYFEDLGQLTAENWLDEFT